MERKWISGRYRRSLAATRSLATVSFWQNPFRQKYGIRTGEPVANAFRKCPNLKSYPPDHQMYREYSRRLMDFLRTYTTHIEQVSVDECYMDFTEIADRFTSPVEGANEIKDEVYKRFGFTVNVGISSRKVLAKMASDLKNRIKCTRCSRKKFW